MLLPRRVVQNVKSHLIYTIALIVIVIVGLPFIQTIFSVLWKGNVVLSSIAIFILVGLFYALPEKSRLDRDGEQMRQFRKDVSDGTYDMKADILEILKSPEFFSDCFAILCLVLAVIVIFVIFFIMSFRFLAFFFTAFFIPSYSFHFLPLSFFPIMSILQYCIFIATQ